MPDKDPGWSCRRQLEAIKIGKPKKSLLQFLTSSDVTLLRKRSIERRGKGGLKRRLGAIEIGDTCETVASAQPLLDTVAVVDRDRADFLTGSAIPGPYRHAGWRPSVGN